MSLMKRSLIIISTFTVMASPLLMLNACRDPLFDENDQLREEIIIVHDGAMEKIGLLYDLQKRLNTKTGCSTECVEYIHTLQQADEAMFAWMRQYRPLPADKDLEDDTRYRRQQLEQIKEVQRLMEKAIREAETYLKGSA